MNLLYDRNEIINLAYEAAQRFKPDSFGDSKTISVMYPTEKSEVYYRVSFSAMYDADSREFCGWSYWHLEMNVKDCVE